MKIHIAWTAETYWGLGIEWYGTYAQKGLHIQVGPWLINLKLWHPHGTSTRIWEGYMGRRKHETKNPVR